MLKPSYFRKPIIPCIITKILKRDLDEADNISRKISWIAYRRIVDIGIDLKEYIDKATGGLGYRGRNIGGDWERVVALGCCIAWADSVSSKDRVFEIGTGLGRTTYCLQYYKPEQIITVDIDPIITGIALYNNPYHEFQEALRESNVKLTIGDAVVIAEILYRMGYLFTHIVHDGGPNPKRNKKLYSRYFFKILDKLLLPGGRISVFSGKDPLIIDKIYHILESLGYKAQTITPIGIPVRVVRGIKPILNHRV
jgi:predicted membrane-bound spermidine synthase